jgi:hypothetical protein
VALKQKIILLSWETPKKRARFFLTPESASSERLAKEWLPRPGEAAPLSSQFFTASVTRDGLGNVVAALSR